MSTKQNVYSLSTFLTRTRVEKLSNREGARPLFVRDSKLIGFGLKVTPKDAKTFFVEARSATATGKESRRFVLERGQGNAITPFLIDVAREAFIDGVGFILVDFPPIPQKATLADQRRSNVQPYWVKVTAENLIGWRSKNLAGRQVLTQVRIKEQAAEQDGEFGEKAVERIRVIEPGGWRVYSRLQDPRTGSENAPIVGLP